MLSSFDIIKFIQDTYHIEVVEDTRLVATTKAYLNKRDLPITPNLFSHVMGTMASQHDTLLLAVSIHDIEHADLSSHPTVWQNISRNITRISASSGFSELASTWYGTLTSKIESLPSQHSDANTLTLMMCATLAQDLHVSEHLIGNLPSRVSKVITNLWQNNEANAKISIEVFLYKSILNNKTLSLPTNELIQTILRKGQISNTDELQTLLDIAHRHFEAKPYIGECLAYNMFHPVTSNVDVAFDRALMSYWFFMDTNSLAWKQTAIAVGLHYADSSPKVQSAGAAFLHAIEAEWPNEWKDIQQKIEMLKSVNSTSTLCSIENIDLLAGIDSMTLVQTPLPQEFVHD